MQKIILFLSAIVVFNVYAYTPQEAIQDINNGKLTYMGRDLFPGSFQNSSCVYKSLSAYIIYNNCPLSKLEAPATDIEVVSFKGGLIRFYVENLSPRPISRLIRTQYDSTWTIEYTQSRAPGDLSVKGLMDYKEEIYNGNDLICYVGESFEAQNLETKGKCLANSTHGQDWLSQTETFWLEPGTSWYETKKYLRRVISGTKF